MHDGNKLLTPVLQPRNPSFSSGRWYTPQYPVATQIDSWVKEFETRRGAADGPVEANPDLVRLTGELDGAYWREVERLLVQTARENSDRIVFTPDLSPGTSSIVSAL